MTYSASFFILSAGRKTALNPFPREKHYVHKNFYLFPPSWKLSDPAPLPLPSDSAGVTLEEARLKIFPTQIDFFEHLDKIATNVSRAADVLVSAVEMPTFDGVDQKVKEIYEIEQEGDMLTHDIMKKLNKTFITPIDPEDLHALASKLDDIVDLIWASMERILLFNIPAPTKECILMAKDIQSNTTAVQKAIRKLREKDYSFVHEYCIEINRLENRIDRHFKTALVDLFDNTSDPILIIKWKEVYEHLEDASDSCEDVADILEAIILKYA